MGVQLKEKVARLFLILALSSAGLLQAQEIIKAPEPDSHYTAVGFFDIHVCHWPKRPLLFLLVFSSYQFTNVAAVDVYFPTGKLLARIDTSRFRIVQEKGKPEKHVYMQTMDVPKGANDGWYSAIITMRDGTRYEAKDLVAIKSMGLATDMVPVSNAEDIDMPSVLTWKAVPGAKAYQVFIRDIWNGETDVLPSTIVGGPVFKVPESLLKKGGYYMWRIQARDSNESVLLGDFNHGSLSDWSKFSIKE